MNLSRNLVLAIVGIVVLAGLLFFFFRQSQPTTIVEEVAPPVDTASEAVFSLAQQNGSGESGSATFREVDGQVVVTLELTGAPEGVAQPAHIHVGNCPDVGAVTYPLESPVNGQSETTLDVTFEQLRSELPLAVNVHKSQAEASVYVSCADLIFN